MQKIDIIGSGFLPGIPGLYGNQRIKLNENGEVIEVVPLGQPFRDEVEPGGNTTESLPGSSKKVKKKEEGNG